MKKRVFQFCVVLHTINKYGECTDSKMIIEPTVRLAKSEKDLLFGITREIPEEYAEDPDNVEILIRNF